MGDGFVEAIDSNTLQAIANAQPAAQRGTCPVRVRGRLMHDGESWMPDARRRDPSPRRPGRDREEQLRGAVGGAAAGRDHFLNSL